MNEVTAAEPQAEVGGVQVSLQSVYLKDCSYESPNGPRLPSNQTWEPKFQLNMNTSTEELSPEAREVLLTVTVEAKQGDITLYLVEVKQAGLFTICGRVGRGFEAARRQLLSRRVVSLRARSDLRLDRQGRLP